MTEKRITAATATPELRELYDEAFPAEERIPWHDLLQLVGTMPLDFTAYYHDNQLLGFTIVYPRPTFNWFWYFAVRPQLRGMGHGQRILSRLIERYSSGTSILDMESPSQPSPNQPVRQRRHRFYLRNGFRDTGVGRSFQGIDYTIMIIGPGTFTMHDYDAIIAELHAKWTP